MLLQNFMLSNKVETAFFSVVFCYVTTEFYAVKQSGGCTVADTGFQRCLYYPLLPSVVWVSYTYRS